MKRGLILFMAVVLASSLFANGEQEKAAATSKAQLKDGFYMAVEDNYSEKSGWKGIVTLEVKNGKITSVDWDAVHKTAGDTKDVQSKDGRYGMAAKGGAQAPWYEQADKAEKFLLEKQNPSALTFDEGGYTDAVSGVTIHVNDFVALVQEALQKGPVGRGPYKDGAYHAEDSVPDDKGRSTSVDLTVVGGQIVSAYWNEIDQEGKDKKTLSQNGEYGMFEKGGSQSPWYEQAQLMEAYLVENQDFSGLKLTDGKPDAISGASITVTDFVEVADKALNKAK